MITAREWLAVYLRERVRQGDLSVRVVRACQPGSRLASSLEGATEKLRGRFPENPRTAALYVSTFTYKNPPCANTR